LIGVAGFEGTDAASPFGFRSVSLFDPTDRLSVPTCLGLVTPRAAAVKDGPLGPPPEEARSVLEGGEHGVTLAVVGTAVISSNCPT
jgi:hypothetical protein